MQSTQQHSNNNTTHTAHSAKPLPKGGGFVAYGDWYIAHMAQPPRPCLSCDVLTNNGTRCAVCAPKFETKRTSKRVRPHYNNEYKKRAKEVREAATVCWLCGEGARANDDWTADHVLPADMYSPLLPAHRSCNSRRGNKPPDFGKRNIAP